MKVGTSTWHRLGLIASGISIVPCFLFGVWGEKFKALHEVEKGVLIATIVGAMVTCSLVSGYNRLVGSLVLPLVFLGLSTLVCLWITW